jgi:hypothetical protein
MLDIFSPGSEVEVGSDKLRATIVSVCVKGKGHVEYNVSYWKADNTYTEVWLPSLEVRGFAGAKKEKIGFRLSTEDH